MKPFELRLIDEYSELCGKLEALKQFTSSDLFKQTVTDENKALLQKQESIMWQYRDVLWQRIKIIGEPE